MIFWVYCLFYIITFTWIKRSRSSANIDKSNERLKTDWDYGNEAKDWCNRLLLICNLQENSCPSKIHQWYIILSNELTGNHTPKISPLTQSRQGKEIYCLFLFFSRKMSIRREETATIIYPYTRFVYIKNIQMRILRRSLCRFDISSNILLWIWFVAIWNT